jgi:hypothetical protein
MATALQPQFTTSARPREEWERLPWLFDEPKRVRRQPSRWILVGLILFATADALCAYAAGRLSMLHGQAIAAISVHRIKLSTEDSRALAEQIASAEGVGWQRRRPNAAY